MDKVQKTIGYKYYTPSSETFGIYLAYVFRSVIRSHFVLKTCRNSLRNFLNYYIRISVHFRTENEKITLKNDIKVSRCSEFIFYCW
jgi:hypothetical protein